MKRISALILTFILTATLCCGIASANSKASEYISAYNVILFTGDNRGEIEVSYSVSASRPVNFVGVSKIRIYTEDGILVKTITGTEDNGLLRTNGGQRHSGDFVVKLTAGTSYYARVNVTAGLDDENSDFKIVTTNTKAAAS